MNLNNPFADIPVTNPSPFKLFKSQTPSMSSINNPPPQANLSNSTAFYSNFTSSMNNQPVPNNSFNPPNNFYSNSGTSNQTNLPKTSLNPAKDSMFAGNKDLETKKNSHLNKKRIQDLLED